MSTHFLDERVIKAIKLWDSNAYPEYTYNSTHLYQSPEIYSTLNHSLKLPPIQDYRYGSNEEAYHCPCPGNSLYSSASESNLTTLVQGQATSDSSLTTANHTQTISSTLSSTENSPKQCNKSLKSEKPKKEKATPYSRTGKSRPNLPKSTVRYLKQWLFSHLDRPYPTEREKDQIMLDTQISITQLNNFFINARRRIITSHEDEEGNTVWEIIPSKNSSI